LVITETNEVNQMISNPKPFPHYRRFNNPNSNIARYALISDDIFAEDWFEVI